MTENRFPPNGNSRKPYRRSFVILFVLYLFFLLKLLFFKITIVFADISISGNVKSSFTTLLAASNFIPLYKIYYYASGQEPYLVGLLNVAGNVLLFVPMGFFLPFIFRKINTGKRLLLVLVIVSLSVEVLQLLTVTGEFDVDDIILNTAGGMLGYLFFPKRRTTTPQREESSGRLRRR